MLKKHSLDRNIFAIAIRMILVTIGISWIHLLMLATYWSNIEYSLVWKDYFDKYSNICRFPDRPEVEYNKKSYAYKEHQCISKSNKLLSNYNNLIFNSHNTSISKHKNICITIMTSHKNRENIDYFNLTIASLIYSYNKYIKQSKDISLINMDLNIIITKPRNAFTKSRKETFLKKATVYNNNILNIFYYLYLPYKKFRDVLVYGNYYAMNVCKDKGYTVSLNLEDDVIVSDQMFYHLDHILFNELNINNKEQTDWLYIRLFHTEYWSGWGSHKESVIEMILLFIISSYLYRLIWVYFNLSAVLNLYRLNEFTLVHWKKIKLRTFLLFVISYLFFGISFIGIVHSIGRQNLMFHGINKYKELVPYEYTQQTAMSQANLYNLKHIEQWIKYFNRMRKEIDLSISSYSQTKGYERFTYFPSLVQHTGRVSSDRDKNEAKRCQMNKFKRSQTFDGTDFCLL